MEEENKDDGQNLPIDFTPKLGIELDDFSSLLTESTNGGIEAFAKYL